MTTLSQDLRVVSSHQGEIRSAIISFSDTSLESHIHGPEIEYGTADNLIRMLQDMGSVTCAVFKREFMICKPISNLETLSVGLRFKNTSSQDSVGLYRLFSAIKAEGLKIRKKKMLVKVDLDELFIEFVQSERSASPEMSGIGGMTLEDKQSTIEPYRNYFELVNSWYAKVEEAYNAGRLVSFGGEPMYSELDIESNLQLDKRLRIIMGCKKTKMIADEVEAFAQDYFLVFETDSSNVLVPRFDARNRTTFSWDSDGIAYCSSIDAYIGNVDVEGGNTLVSGPFLFIGKDALHKKYQFQSYQSVKDSMAVVAGLDSLQLPHNATKEQVTEKLSTVFGRQVVWVGMDEIEFDFTYSDFRLELEDAPQFFSYQPVYHIDVFLHPIKYVSAINEQAAEITFLVGMPNSVNWALFKDPGITTRQRFIADSIVTSLEKRVRETMNNLSSVLQTKFLTTVNFVEIPLPIGFRKPFNYVKSYASYANGLINENKDGKATYYMPEYVNIEKKYMDPETAETASRIIESETELKVVRIKAWYSGKSGIRCSTLVTSRKTAE